MGIKRFVAQSYAPWPYARTGGPVKSEDDPLDTDPPAQVRTTLEAIRTSSGLSPEAEWTEGIALRYGGFYGPGTSFSLDPPGEQIEMIRQRKFPLAGKASGVWSFIHVEDAAAATVEAIEHGARGIYNVVDDEPAPVSEWLPELAKAIGASRPGASRSGSPGSPGATLRQYDVRVARLVEQEGEARARLAAALCELARGLREGARLAMASTDLFEELRPRGVRDRVPDARQRERGGGRRAGGPPPPPPHARGRVSGSSRRGRTSRPW